MNSTARLGAFILGALVILIATIFLIGEKEFLFTRTYKLYAGFDNVAGLANGAPVRLGGVHVGTVDHVHAPGKPGEKVTVVMDLKNSTRQVIREDSIASILTEGLLGNKFVSISFGSQKAEPVHPDDTIGSEAPVDLSDIIRKSDETLENVSAATENLRDISDKIKRGEGTVGALVNDRSFYEDMRQTAAETKVGATAFQENMAALKKNWFFRGFYKDRGYQDPAELTANEIARLPRQQPVKKFVFRTKDVFDKPDTAKLKNEKNLKQAGEFLEKTRFDLVVVIANTGAQGEKNQNLELSRAQAMNVRKYLVDHFKIDDARVKTRGAGEAPQSDGSHVEVVVY